LTTEDEDFRRFLKSAPESAVSLEERNAREAYRYSKVCMRKMIIAFAKHGDAITTPPERLLTILVWHDLDEVAIGLSRFEVTRDGDV
jgi:hypothetical protein